MPEPARSRRYDAESRSSVALPSAIRFVLLLISLVSIPAAGCAPEQGRATREDHLVFMDSVLAELGGTPTAEMSRGQRWRMISSMGAGLPPSNFQAQNLPDPTSRGAVLVQAFCQRCHGIPAPQMHAAEEWPILMRRMLMRARTLQDRMGGPVTSGTMGDMLMAGMASADVPSAEDADTIVAYLQAHALPTVDPGRLGDGPDARLFLRECSKCHETPSPTAHSPEEWAAVVTRMRGNTFLMDVPTFSEEEARRIVGFLGEHASG